MTPSTGSPSDDAVVPTVLPYGTWPSPVSAASLVEGVVTPTELVVDGADVYWSESRPSEGGRVAVVRWRDGSTVEVTPPDANVRNRVHEYGGAAWWVADGLLVYSDLADGRLRRLDLGVPPAAAGNDRVDTGAGGDSAPGAGDAPAPRFLTAAPPTPGAVRFADGRPTPDGAWWIGVRERHAAERHEVANAVVAVALDGSGREVVLVEGADFYAAPRVAPGGDRLAWLAWDLPWMPWDAAELWVADLSLSADGAPVLGPAEPVAGGGDHSVGQPEWGADGSLFFLTDASGWSNLVRRAPDGTLDTVIAGDFDIGGPAWTFGEARYAVRDDGAVVAALGRPGGDVLYTTSDEVLSGWTTIEAVRLDASGRPVLLAANHQSLPVVAMAGDPPVFLSTPSVHGVPAGFLPPPEAITFATTDDAVAHGLFYRPANPRVAGPDDELPPLLVLAHGGPTGAARRFLQLAIRFWTSRGWAVVDVDYRGSSGYGRAYLRSLDGRWGVADVEDCVAAAQYLVARGDVDGDRLAIRGGSAGGFTVLAALTFHDVFSVGGLRYGIADLEALAADTHKFEAGYLETLVGPHPAAADRYRERSPIHHLDRLRAPMIVLQGSEDAVVPPAQAEMLVAALAARGIEHEYVLFDGEGHGFRRAETIVAALEAEEAFFARVLGLGDRR